MKRDELLGRRWAAQALAQPKLDPVGVVARLGAIQAQDPKMVLAAVALRGHGLRTSDVEAALDAGELVRTHVLRPTWHLVAAKDLRWMTALTAERIRIVARSNQRGRGLTPEVLLESERLLEKALEPGPQTRATLVVALQTAGLAVDENRASHYFMNAEIDLVLCNGPRKHGEATYDLVDRRIAQALPVPREEALARLAERYVGGHGPATDRDFSWWSGLSLTDARRGLAGTSTLIRGEYEGEPVWFDPRHEPVVPEGVHFLPAYDEYLIAFADRSAAMDEADASRWITRNGIFHPVVLDEGRVTGRWQRPIRSNVPIEVEWFRSVPKGAQAALNAFSDWWARP